LNKRLINTPRSSFWVVTRSTGLLAFLLVGFAASAHADNDKNKEHHAPEIATGAAIGAFVLAGGGLLLLADRLRGRKKTKP